MRQDFNLNVEVSDSYLSERKLADNSNVDVSSYETVEDEVIEKSKEDS